MEVTASREIPAPTADVFSYATAPGTEPDWISGIHSARKLTKGNVGEGTRVERRARFLGREILYILEVKTWDPPNRVRMVSVEGPFPMDVSYAFEPSTAGTQATIQLKGESSGVLKIAAPLLGWASRRGIRRDLANLADHFS